MNAQGSLRIVECCAGKGKQGLHRSHCRYGFGVFWFLFACASCSSFTCSNEMQGLDLEWGLKHSILFLAQGMLCSQSALQVYASAVSCNTGLGPTIKVVCSWGIQRMGAVVSWKPQNPWAESWLSLPGSHTLPKQWECFPMRPSLRLPPARDPHGQGLPGEGGWGSLLVEPQTGMPRGLWERASLA